MIPAKCKGPCGRTLVIWDLNEFDLCDDCMKLKLNDGFVKHAKKYPDLAKALKIPVEFQGFTEPEPGSEDRYIKRQKERPWVAHQFWWFVHNNISHPLIGIIPITTFFKFHDWTSRKMHGK